MHSAQLYFYSSTAVKSSYFRSICISLQILYRRQRARVISISRNTVCQSIAKVSLQTPLHNGASEMCWEIKKGPRTKWNYTPAKSFKLVKYCRAI